MPKRKGKEISISGITAPDWAMISPDIKPFTTNGIKRDYHNLLQGALWYVHYEVSDKVLKTEFLKYCNDRFDKKDVKKLKVLPDYRYATIGKYAYIIAKGGKLTDDKHEEIAKWYVDLLEKAEELTAKLDQEKELEDAKPKPPVISIQDRMREQVSELCGYWEGYLDEILFGDLTLKKFDPYLDMQKSNTQIKPAHAKIIKDMFEGEYQEALIVKEWNDEDIKEGYGNFNATMRKEFVEFYEKIFIACDTIINEGKANRKTRVKKAPSKTKLVEKIKYKESESTLGLASINPLSIIDASTLWVYNTKNRKLGMYVADSMQGPLSVKGTTIIGFDTTKSTQKTIRKPEILKGSDKLARTKFDKLFTELKTTETKLNGRVNEHTILIKVF